MSYGTKKPKPSSGGTGKRARSEEDENATKATPLKPAESSTFLILEPHGDILIRCSVGQ
jgi:hypothetical protein